MSEVLEFACRNDFRNWLRENCLSDAGVWSLFGKPGGPQTVKADEALEEALCFGWIDGQMKSMNETSYRKYFSLRRDNSKWSEKNKKLVEQLEKQGIMTDYGRKKIEEAKKNGQWNAPKAPAITEEEIASVVLCWKPMNLPSLIFRPCRRPSKRLIRVLIWMQKQRPDGRNAWLG